MLPDKNLSYQRTSSSQPASNTFQILTHHRNTEIAQVKLRLSTSLTDRINEYGYSGLSGNRDKNVPTIVVSVWSNSQ